MSFGNEARGCEPPALLHGVPSLCLRLHTEHDFLEQTAWLALITISNLLRSMSLRADTHQHLFQRLWRGKSCHITYCVLVTLEANGTTYRLVEPIDPKDPEQHPVDLTIKCGSLDVQTHSHVLCQESSYFKVICKGGFLVCSNYAVLIQRSSLTTSLPGRVYPRAQPPCRGRISSSSPLVLLLHNRIQRRTLRRRE